MGYGRSSGASQGCRFLRSLAIGGAVAFALSSCGAETKPAAQYDEIVARVNGQEITVHQLNDRLTQLGLAGKGDAATVRSQLLDALIDERLLVQKAIAEGLDRQRMTQGAIERARLRLLAQAAIEDSSGASAISDREARAFYLEHPDLFGKRRVYTFRRYLLENGKLRGAARAQLESAKSAAEVAAVLKAAGIAYSQLTEVRTAESLPEAILVRAARMESGDILLYNEASRTVLMQLAASIAEPIQLEAALPSIKDYLVDARRQQRAERLVKDLRRKAKIEYVTRTAGMTTPTALADGNPVLGEPPAQKPLQSHQTTVVR